MLALTGRPLRPEYRSEGTRPKMPNEKMPNQKTDNVEEIAANTTESRKQRRQIRYPDVLKICSQFDSSWSRQLPAMCPTLNVRVRPCHRPYRCLAERVRADAASSDICR